MNQSIKKSLDLSFDIKNKDIIVWNNQVIMSRTEEDYFKKLFSYLEKYGVYTKCTLEIGFGLGISSSLIQKHLLPEEHSIVEIEENIFNDLTLFAKGHPSVKPFLGDWRILKDIPKNYYDFIFHDAYDYLEDGNDSQFSYQEQYDIFYDLLKKEGIVCHPHFGDGSIRDVKGFQTSILKRVKVSPIKMWDGSICEDAAIILRKKQQ